MADTSENARLQLKVSKKNKIIATLFFTDTKKSMPFPQFNTSDTSLDQAVVKVLRHKGKIINVMKGDDVLYQTPQKNVSPQTDAGRQKALNVQLKAADDLGDLEMDHVKTVYSKAHAPYNFVPLNKIVVKAKDNVPVFDRYDTNRNTGFIKVTIETKTPLYIRGTLTEKELSSEKGTNEKPDFFSPANSVRIPGSSLRGMTRTLVEIASFGRFLTYNDRRLYFRALADKSNLRMEYQKKMSSYDRYERKSKHMFSAGILCKQGMSYKILPSGYDQIYKEDAKNRIQSSGQKYKDFSFYPMPRGFIVVSGDMKNKKRDWWVDLPDPNGEPIPLTKQDLDDYRNDITRSQEVPDLLKHAEDGEVPCFYVRWIDTNEKDRISFGHTGMFRLAYQYRIGDHIPEFHKEKHIDIPEAIFGNEESFAGRVFFEDAHLESEQTNVFMSEGFPKILSSPKPTTFQHYLTQSNDNIRDLNHYNSPAAIRGHKLYWHKSGKHWEQTDQNEIIDHASQYTKIKPVRPEIKFKGCIRFENLSNIELGALLFALDLPPGCCHKLGMGKPLGLGTIHIQSDLYLSDRKKRYQLLFAERSLELSDKKEGLIDEFDRYIRENIGANDIHNLWEHARMKELSTLLNVQTGIHLEEKNTYMSIQAKEFRNRPVLPLASEVK
jgi:hypothetical protein